VQVNVVVNDKNGRPILGLDKDSFTLLDDKKAQRVEILSIDTNATPATARATSQCSRHFPPQRGKPR
jgi:hypothetical protein